MKHAENMLRVVAVVWFIGLMVYGCSAGPGEFQHAVTWPYWSVAK